MNSITELAEQQNTIEEDGIEVRLEKIDVEPDPSELYHWSIEAHMDGEPVYFSGQNTFNYAKIDQIRVYRLLTKNSVQLRKFASQYGWENVLPQLCMREWGDKLTLKYPSKSGGGKEW